MQQSKRFAFITTLFITREKEGELILTPECDVTIKGTATYDTSADAAPTYELDEGADFQAMCELLSEGRISDLTRLHHAVQHHVELVFGLKEPVLLTA